MEFYKWRASLLRYACKLVVPTIWLLCAWLLFDLSPQRSKMSAILALRFYSFLLTYGIAFWCIWACQQKPWFTFLIGLCTITIGLARVFAELPIPPSSPNFWTLWFMANAYLAFLCSLTAFLQTLKPKSLYVNLGLFFFLAMTFSNLFWLLHIVAYWPAYAQTIILLFFYLNPLVVMASCFPGYDYLRGIFFYEIFPIASYLGPYQYPDWKYAVYGYIAGACLFIAFSVLWCKKGNYATHSGA